MKDLAWEAGLETPSSGFIEWWKKWNSIFFKSLMDKLEMLTKRLLFSGYSRMLERSCHFSLKDCYNIDETVCLPGHA